MTAADPSRPSGKRLFLVLGPSGVGKTTAVRCLRARLPWIHHPVSYTTRSPRPGERAGEDYHFVGQEEFLRLRDAGALLEWDQPHGTHFYGIPAEPVMSRLRAGEVVVREIAVHGLEQVLAGPAAAHVYSVFLLPGSPAELSARLARRDEPAAAERLARAEQETALADRCDAVLHVTEGAPEAACDALEALIRRHAVR